MKATSRQIQIFRSAFDDRMTEIMNSLSDYEDTMSDVIMDEHFKEIPDDKFFVILAHEAVIKRCRTICDDAEYLDNADLQIDRMIAEINDEADADDDNENPDE